RPLGLGGCTRSSMMASECWCGATPKACAFSPATGIELNGDDLRREPIERRKVSLIRLLAKASAGLQVNDHIVQPGDVVFRHACQLGFEGIVSKRLGSPYRSGRSPHWIKSKNQQHPAVKREAEEDWGSNRRRSQSTRSRDLYSL